MNSAQLQYHHDKALSDVARLEKQQLLCVIEGHDDEATICDVVRAFWADEARALRATQRILFDNPRKHARV